MQELAFLFWAVVWVDTTTGVELYNRNDQLAGPYPVRVCQELAEQIGDRELIVKRAVRGYYEEECLLVSASENGME